jgi:hypothetical protein
MLERKEVEKFEQYKVTGLDRLSWRTWQATIVDDSGHIPMGHTRIVKKFTLKAAQREADMICFMLNAEKFKTWPVEAMGF